VIAAETLNHQAGNLSILLYVAPATTNRASAAQLSNADLTKALSAGSESSSNIDQKIDVLLLK
jgi:hypothetical protein